MLPKPVILGTGSPMSEKMLCAPLRLLKKVRQAIRRYLPPQVVNDKEEEG